MADGGRWLTFFSLVQKVPQRISPLYRPHIHNNICPPGASPQLSIAEENLYSQTCVILSMKEYISNFGYCRYVSNMRDGSPPPSVPVWLAVKILFVVLAFFSFFKKKKKEVGKKEKSSPIGTKCSTTAEDESLRRSPEELVSKRWKIYRRMRSPGQKNEKK